MNEVIQTAHREMYWHIGSPYRYLIYPMATIAVAAFAYGVWKKIEFWRAGRPDPKRLGDWWTRARRIMFEVPLQTRVLRDFRGGLMHVMIFWSFLVLMLATAIVFVDVDFKIPIFKGWLYVLVSLFADLAGLFLLAGAAYASFRRYVVKAKRLDNQEGDAMALALIGLIALTGFFMEGMRIHYTEDPWAAWSPVGYLVSLGFGELGATAQKRVYQSVWWLHAIAAFSFIGAIPYTKLFHIFTMPANAYFASLEPKGSLERVDIEALMSDEAALTNFSVGVNEVKDTTWKQRLDLDSCIRCGRCLEVCPCHLNGHPLAPRTLINDLKNFAHAEYENSRKPAPQAAGEEAPPTEPAEPKTIVGNAFSDETIWECRTCRACTEVCPAHIEHVPLIMELRRGEVMMRGQVPSEASVALKTFERAGNPFGPQEERSKWIQDMRIPVIREGEECEALLWIGCTTTFDQVKQKVAYHVLTILHEAGIHAGVMGDDEFCCGDPARVLGDENLFQAHVKNQIQRIQSRKFKYLITQCPHCYNVFKNEYPQFGSAFKVVHHTEIIHELIKNKRIELEMPIARTVAYHDPCYLGRYNEIYDKPREILRAIKGVNLVEFELNREKSQCCGGGGGHYWMDLQNGERLNVARTKAAVRTGAEILAVGCVFCLQMLNDSVKILDIEDAMKVHDVSELVVEAMGGIPEVVSKPTLEKWEQMVA